MALDLTSIRPRSAPQAAGKTRPRALAALLGLALWGGALAQAAPSLAEQMRAMLGKPALPGSASGGGRPAPATPAAAGPAASVAPLSPNPAAPAATAPATALATASLPAGGTGLIADGPPQLRQSATALAQPFPAAQRAAMTRAFEESFLFWQKLETQLGLTPNDLGAALAGFIAGNYAVFMQQEVPDEQFRTLVRQMQGIVSQSAGFRQASPAQRRSMFEQMAMVGTFMVVYREQLKTRPNPAEEVHFRNTAKANLEAALGVGVERVRIGAQGLELR